MPKGKKRETEIKAGGRQAEGTERRERDGQTEMCFVSTQSHCASLCLQVSFVCQLVF